MKVFVDTSAFYAAVDRDDRNHKDAASFFRASAKERRNLVTTNFIVVETHALILGRIGRDLASQWLASIPAFVERGTSEDEERATNIIFSYRDKDFSLCDAISFAVMDRLKVEHFASFDPHFRQFGRFAPAV